MAGLSSKLAPDDLIYLYQEVCIQKDANDQSFKLTQLDNINKDLCSEIENFKTIKKEKDAQIYTLEKQCLGSAHANTIHEDTIMKLKHDLVKYGNHTLHCNYVDTVSVGKVGPKDTELTLCDCEYTKKKIDALGLKLKDKNEQPQEIIQDDSSDLE